MMPRVRLFDLPLAPGVTPRRQRRTRKLSGFPSRLVASGSRTLWLVNRVDNGTASRGRGRPSVYYKLAPMIRFHAFKVSVCSRYFEPHSTPLMLRVRELRSCMQLPRLSLPPQPQ